MSQLKTGLSSVKRICLVYGILENTKTCLCGNKADDVFETNHCHVLLLCRNESGTLNKHPGFQQRYEVIHK